MYIYCIIKSVGLKGIALRGILKTLLKMHYVFSKKMHIERKNNISKIFYSLERKTHL